MKVAEIFQSIHGEMNGHHQGRICTFIRFSGCPNKCHYCDTPETQDFSYGTDMSVHDIMQEVKKLKSPYICLTGGEPLSQNKYELLDLTTKLKTNYLVSCETSGVINPHDIFGEDFNLYLDSVIMDYKIGTDLNPDITKYTDLKEKDVIKFVVGNYQELDMAITQYFLFRTMFRSIFAFEPHYAFSTWDIEKFTPKMIFDYLIRNEVYDAIISLQIHKLIGFR